MPLGALHVRRSAFGGRAELGGREERWAAARQASSVMRGTQLAAEHELAASWSRDRDGGALPDLNPNPNPNPIPDPNPDTYPNPNPNQARCLRSTGSWRRGWAQ
eukprot:scaffold89376_cov45-Phaeocystis_antarctica.AAC.1